MLVFLLIYLFFFLKLVKLHKGSSATEYTVEAEIFFLIYIWLLVRRFQSCYVTGTLARLGILMSLCFVHIVPSNFKNYCFLFAPCVHK